MNQEKWEPLLEDNFNSCTVRAEESKQMDDFIGSLSSEWEVNHVNKQNQITCIQIIQSFTFKHYSLWFHSTGLHLSSLVIRWVYWLWQVEQQCNNPKLVNQEKWCDTVCFMRIGLSCEVLLSSCIIKFEWPVNNETNPNPYCHQTSCNRVEEQSHK